MFTGIIAATGSIQSIEDRRADRRFTFDTGKLDLSDISVGDSISVNGTCLTVIELQARGFSTDLSTETLGLTTFAAALKGMQVNLEKALSLSDRLGGHIVSGHVDGIGLIRDFYEDARSLRFEIVVPVELNRYMCKKGSVCIDGVSLTVNDVVANSIFINIIPHTMEETIFSTYKKETPVNLEVDLIARYLEGLQRENK